MSEEDAATGCAWTEETMTTVPGLYQLERDLTRDELIAELAATPDRVRELVSGCSAEAFQRHVDRDAWSALAVCRHIRDAMQVYGMRFKWMILQDDPFLPNYDEDGWVADSPDCPADLAAMIEEMAAYRAETIRLLRSLRPDGWQRSGRHEVLGSVVLAPYVRHQVAHEESHLAQLREALSFGQ